MTGPRIIEEKRPKTQPTPAMSDCWLPSEFLTVGDYQLTYEVDREDNICWVHVPGALELPANPAIGRHRPIRTSAKFTMRRVIELAEKRKWKIRHPKLLRKRA